ncbi:MAG: phosphatase PAP2 family protein [Terracidiphilus sp.]
MIHPHFSLSLVQFLADHRNPLLTRLFLTASFFGSANFYVFLTIFLYVAYDKRFAIRLSVLVLLTMACNDLVKLFVRNPRPFIAQGTWPQKWAVSPADAKSLASEFSTPSGHAMGSSAFYAYIAVFARSRVARALLVLLIVLIGISRPYLGVHYVEDVLIGWAFGIPIALLAARFFDRLANSWSKRPHAEQIVVTAAASMAIFLVAAALNGFHIDEQVRDVTAYCGFLTGIVIACPLELRIVNFDPRSGSVPAKIARYALSILLLAVALFGLKAAFRPLAAAESAPGCALEFLRYVIAEVVAMFFAPWLFCKMNLAQPAISESERAAAAL